MIVSSKDLARATAYAARAIAVRPDPPVMAAMRLVAEGNTLTCEGVGDDLFSRIRIEGSGFDTGEMWSLLAGGRHLAVVAARLGGEVEVEPQGQALMIRAGRERYSFPAIDPLGWPRAAEMPPLIGMADAEELAEALRVVDAASDAQSANPAHTFVQIFDDYDHRLHLQGFRSAIAARAVVPWSPLDTPGDMFYLDAGMLRGLLPQKGDVCLHADEGRFGVSDDTSAATVRLAAVKHPGLDKAFTHHEFTLTVDRAELHEALDKALLFTDNQHPRLALEPSEDELRLVTFGREERAEIVLAAAWDGPDGARFGVNPAYLKTCSTSIRDTTLRILANPAHESAPLLFVAGDHGDHLVALVPVKPSEVC